MQGKTVGNQDFYKVVFTSYGSTVSENKKTWDKEAKCKGLDASLFYPNAEEDVLASSQICWGCPVQIECLEYALAYPERYGIFGGYGAEERLRLRRHMNRYYDASISELEDRPKIIEALKEIVAKRTRFLRKSRRSGAKGKTGTSKAT